MKTKKTYIIGGLFLIFICVVVLRGNAQCHGGGNMSHDSHNKNQNEDAKESIYYTCPMHANIKSALPGKCTQCGMNLEPGKEDNKSGKKTKKLVYYVCEMHPEAKFEKKGKCPVCGMKMKKKKEFVY